MEVLSDDEQRAKWDWELSKGIIDVADILMQKDADRFPDRESAQAYLDERTTITQSEESPQGSLLEALTTPVS